MLNKAQAINQLGEAFQQLVKDQITFGKYQELVFDILAEIDPEVE
jgi:hypothetical protein